MTRVARLHVYRQGHPVRNQTSRGIDASGEIASSSSRLDDRCSFQGMATDIPARVLSENRIDVAQAAAE
jgi:hypothetical protein